MSDNWEIEFQTQTMRLIRERLKPFKVPNEIMKALRDDIMILLPKAAAKKPFGAAVMTQRASMAADKIRKGQDVAPGEGSPEII